MKADPRLKFGPGQDAEALMLLQGSSEQHSSQEETPQTTWEYFIYKERDEKRLLSWGEAGSIGGEGMGNPDICLVCLRGKDTWKGLNH